MRENIELLSSGLDLAAAEQELVAMVALLTFLPVTLVMAIQENLAALLLSLLATKMEAMKLAAI